MPWNRDTIKAANYRRAKSKGKVIEWETRVHSRGVRDVPVEVSAMASQRQLRKKDRRRKMAEQNDPLQGHGEAAPQSMDVDEIFWAEEPVMPTSEKRVRQPAFPSPTNLTYLPVSAQLH